MNGKQAGGYKAGAGAGEPGRVQLLAQAGGPRALARHPEEAPSRPAGPPDRGPEDLRRIAGGKAAVGAPPPEAAPGWPFLEGRVVKEGD